MSDVRWTVRAGDGETLAQIVAKASPKGALALAEGRVFIGKERVIDGARPVAIGDRVAIYSARENTNSEVRIIRKSADLVAVAKPADLPTVADHRGADRTLVAETARLLGVDEKALFVTSRLDVGVSGVVVFARTERAATRLTRAHEENTYAKVYLAIASGSPKEGENAWNAAIGRSQDARLRLVNGADAKPAHTDVRVVAIARDAALLELRPRTGRTHQLRVHAAHAGVPLLGDGAYGGPTRVVSDSGAVSSFRRIALHAFRVEVPDEKGGRFAAIDPPPQELLAMYRAVAGSDDAWHEFTEKNA